MKFSEKIGKGPLNEWLHFGGLRITTLVRRPWRSYALSHCFYLPAALRAEQSADV